MNKMQIIVIVTIACLTLMISACSTTSQTPVLEKNAYYQKVGSEQANRDVELAVKEAEKDIKSLQKKRKNDSRSTREKTATSVAAGTLVRVATGKMALGLITGSGTRAGAEAKQDYQDKEIFRQDVERRLREKGYQVKYWKDQ